jgi:glycosyltransferase involved in cell wall biosynthesis
VNSKIIAYGYKKIILPIKFSSNLNEINKINFYKIKAIFMLFYNMLRILFFNKIDVVYFTISPYGKAFYRDFLIVLVIKMFKPKLILHIHGLGVNANSANPFYNAISKFIYKNSYTIHLSKSVLNDFKKYKSLVKRQFVVNNGIPDLQDFSHTSTEDNDIVCITYISNYLPIKGHHILINALKELSKKNKKFICYFAGGVVNNDYLKSLKNTVKEAGLERSIFFLDFLQDKDKIDLLKDTDIFAFPSMFESFGIVALEAMRQGVPIIANSEGSLIEIVDDKIGYLYERNSYLDLSKKLEVLIDNRELRKKMGKSARQKFIRKYTVSKFENRMKEVLLYVVKL